LNYAVCLTVRLLKISTRSDTIEDSLDTLWLVVVRLLWLVAQAIGVLGSNPSKLPM